MADANLDAIANDWPALKAAVTKRLDDNAGKIADLTAKVGDLTTQLGNVNPDDPRAAQIDGEIKELLNSINGVATTPITTPAPASPAAGDAGSTAGAGTGASDPAAAPVAPAADLSR